ncbi:MAG TPA: hypothetical protein VK694_03945 [Verrucomicrobiae bacterium]|nr:hypothetical protein [Verrucomicrobiae bacterium]
MSLADLSPDLQPAPQPEFGEADQAELGSILGLRVVECEADDQLAPVQVEPLSPEATVTHWYPKGQAHAATAVNAN